MGSTDLELTGVCFAIKKLDCWLRGVKFLLITDHKSLTFLINKRMDEMKPAIARKVIFLQQYDFDIIHKDGEKKTCRCTIKVYSQHKYRGRC